MWVHSLESRRTLCHFPCQTEFWFGTEFSRLVLFLIAKRKHLHNIFPTLVKAIWKVLFAFRFSHNHGTCKHVLEMFICKIVLFPCFNMRKRPPSNTWVLLLLPGDEVKCITLFRDEKHFHAASPQTLSDSSYVHGKTICAKKKTHFIRLMHLIDGSSLSTKPHVWGPFWSTKPQFARNFCWHNFETHFPSITVCYMNLWMPTPTLAVTGGVECTVNTKIKYHMGVANPA